MDAFKFKHDAKYRTGAEYNASYQFSLVNQDI